MADSTKHDIIYLQVCEDEESEWLGEVTWCQDRINNDDVKYIRADLVEQQLVDMKAAVAHESDCAEAYKSEAYQLRQQVTLLRSTILKAMGTCFDRQSYERCMADPTYFINVALDATKEN